MYMHSKAPFIESIMNLLQPPFKLFVILKHYLLLKQACYKHLANVVAYVQPLAIRMVSIGTFKNIV